MGGSMGAVVGEKVTRAAEHALAARVPLVVVSASGGARMQEGTLALMQLAKTLAAIERLRPAGVPFVSILSDPTTGGVFASFAAVGDVNIAEPNALIGFAGARVTAGTIAAELPPGFQRSEFLFEHGFVDRVVARPELRDELAGLLRLLPVRGSLASAEPTDGDLSAFRPLSFLSSIAGRVGELATGDGIGGATDPAPAVASTSADGLAAGAVADRTTASLAGVEADRDDVWARVQLARNLRRPRTLEFVAAMADEFIELHGDRLFGDDAAIVAGLARIDGRRVVVIGQQKGADTEENIRRNFGMPHPEGYRKAMRVMELAERFGLPVVTFVDVPGAYPGPESEERGIAEAIARSIALMTRLRTPIVTVITGEGGSGGALAIAVGDVVVALENAVYSVISPEGCASILWRTSDEAATAAAAMRMTAADQHALGVVDIVVPEPGEGAHAEPEADRQALRAIVLDRLDALDALIVDELVEARYRRYRALGAYTEAAQSDIPERVDRSLADRLRDLLDPARRGIVGARAVTRRPAGSRGGLASARQATITRPPVRSPGCRPRHGSRCDRSTGRRAAARPDRQARRDRPRRARGPGGRLACPAAPTGRCREPGTPGAIVGPRSGSRGGRAASARPNAPRDRTTTSWSRRRRGPSPGASRPRRRSASSSRART